MGNVSGAALLGGPREDKAWSFCNRASVLDSINQFILNAGAALELAPQSTLWRFSICSSTSLSACQNVLSEGIEESNKE